MYKEVLHFWFEELSAQDWFSKSDALDDNMKKRFLSLHKDIVAGLHDDWKEGPESSLAYIIVLDQFSRNMFRDTEKMFKYDILAVEAAKKIIGSSFFTKISSSEKMFIYMPFMHSENIDDQNLCVKLFKELSEEDGKFKNNYDYAVLHRDIVQRFGRFPHRNNQLGRASTVEEEEFLKGPNSSF